MQVKKVMGVRVDVAAKDEVMTVIEKWLAASGRRPKLIATAYSEFFVTAQSDGDFRMALEGSDLVIPDGIGPLAAISYQQMAQGKWLMARLFVGLRVGVEVLSGKVGQPVSGYWLFKELTRRAAERGWRIFLLGGFGETASLVAEKLKASDGRLLIGSDPGSQKLEWGDGENERVIKKINEFKPDLLFVAYGPGKQEKWLAANKSKLSAKVAIGVGGTFDEYLGKVKAAPEVFSRLGLKWLWRLVQQPKRIGRIWKAVVVFPWLVFRQSGRGGCLDISAVEY